MIDVRVLDDRRSPITDLTADDFRVKIDGKPARVESALAMKHLAGVLAGNYVLLVEKPNTEPGTHRIGVDLVRRKGNVLARTSYVG